MWPVEDTGKNSVRPSTMAITMASKVVIVKLKLKVDNGLKIKSDGYVIVSTAFTIGCIII
jgi:hypothetical protein